MGYGISLNMGKGALRCGTGNGKFEVVLVSLITSLTTGLCLARI